MHGIIIQRRKIENPSPGTVITVLFIVSHSDDHARRPAVRALLLTKRSECGLGVIRIQIENGILDVVRRRDIIHFQLRLRTFQFFCMPFSTGSEAAAAADADNALSLLSCAVAGIAQSPRIGSDENKHSEKRESRSRAELGIALMVSPCPLPATRPSMASSPRLSPSAVQDSDLHPAAA